MRCFGWQIVQVVDSIDGLNPLQGVGREFEPLSTHHQKPNKNKGLEQSKPLFFGLLPTCLAL